MEGVWILVGLFVLGSCIWVWMDAREHGIARRKDRQGVWNMNPCEWFLSCLLCWIIAFPVYLVKRKRLAGGKG